MAKRKELKELTLREKVELLRFLENNSQRKTAVHFVVSKTTVSNIQKRKNEYLERYAKESGDLQRRRRRTSLEEVNEATLRWFKLMSHLNIQISGPMIRKIAKMFADEFGVSHFQASKGWLEKFKLRYAIFKKDWKNTGFVAIQERDGVPPIVKSESAFLAMDNDVAIHNEPDSKAIIQMILAETQPKEEIMEEANESKELNDEDTEIIDVPKEVDVIQMMAQLKSFAAEKCPDMLSGIASIETSFCDYLHKNNEKQTNNY